MKEQQKVKSNSKPMQEHQPAKRHQRKIGKVVSAQMVATIVVEVDSFVTHPLYDKKIRRTRRFLAHDPTRQAKLGDIVVIEETRPISKLKRWVLIEVQQSSLAPAINLDDIDDSLNNAQ